MNLEQIKEVLKTDNYINFFNNEHLANNIILLGLGGSYAYGTNTEDSDLDVRGCALNSKKEILLGNGFEQVVDKNTDTTIYSFNKLVKLLSNCNPNVIELLGLKPEHYFIKTDIGEELIKNSHLFLSKTCINSFGGYANSQLRRLDNKAARTLEQEEKEKHILNSINNARYTFPKKYFSYDKDNINLYIDNAFGDNLEKEIYMDINLTHYPLRDYKCMWSEMNNIVKDYAKVRKRNEKAIAAGKLAKHMMHLVRLYHMCFDILEKEQIITYRENEHDLLMDIRNGKFLDNNQPNSAFYDLLNELEKRFEYAKLNTSLPDKCNKEKIDEFVMSVNERIIKNS